MVGWWKVGWAAAYIPRKDVGTHMSTPHREVTAAMRVEKNATQIKEVTRVTGYLPRHHRVSVVRFPDRVSAGSPRRPTILRHRRRARTPGRCTRVRT